ncbi:hypothetical protein [Nocardia asiatica]|uniref:hypothetical protein n=1 Tax=Nocardia asiatica TaxID=209252 RepID=UPI0024572456|nr:hypothetical protein [Nocardia asiatica]
MTADDREQMTRALSRQIRERTPADQRQARALAEHLIDLGWTLRAEHRAIGAAEELDGLAHLSVVLDKHARPWQLTDHRAEPHGDEHGCWSGLGDLYSPDLIELHGPVTLIHDTREATS